MKAKLLTKLGKQPGKVVTANEQYDEDGYWSNGSGASGLLPIARDTKRICLAWRSRHVHMGRCWGVFGGAIKNRKSPEESARAELKEEAGYSGSIESHAAFVFADGNFRFHNFVGLVDYEFDFHPHEDHAWETDYIEWHTLEEIEADIKKNPSKYHPGVVKLFKQSKELIHRLVEGGDEGGPDSEPTEGGQGPASKQVAGRKNRVPENLAAPEGKTANPDFGYAQYVDRENQIKGLHWVCNNNPFDIRIRALEGPNTRASVGFIRAMPKADVRYWLKDPDQYTEKDYFVVSANVEPAWRGTGLGQLLYDRCIAQLKTEGATKLCSGANYKDETRSADAESAWKRLGRRYPVTYNKEQDRYEVDLTRVTGKAGNLALPEAKTAAGKPLYKPTTFHKSVMFHSTHPDRRESILQHGLLRSKSREWYRFGLETEGHKGVWLEEPKGAMWQHRDQEYLSLPHRDCWRVDVTGIPLMKDDTVTAYEDVEEMGVDWWVTYDQDIPPERMTLMDPAPEAKTAAPVSVTETPAFKAWFAGSKVVDASGKPLVVYHGTREDFDQFDTEHGELGSHFGTRDHANSAIGPTKPKTWERHVPRAHDYAGAHLKPCYLSIKNPLRLRDYGGFYQEYVCSQLFHLRLIDGVREQKLLNMRNSADAVREIRKILIDAGYDGVVYLNRREGVDADDSDNEFDDLEFRSAYPNAGESWIAFHPNQIKSAIGNTGQFDPENASITASQVPEAKTAVLQTRRPYADQLRKTSSAVCDVSTAEGYAEGHIYTSSEVEDVLDVSLPYDKLVLLSKIEVVEPYLGKGFGSKLLDQFLAKASSEGCGACILWPFAIGAMAQPDLVSWYQRRGFVSSESFPGMMEKQLSGTGQNFLTNGDRKRTAAVRPTSRVLWHGTSKAYDEIKPNSYGLIWLGDKRTARAYAEMDQLWNTEGKIRLMSFSLNAGAKIIDLRDAQDPLVRRFWTKKSTWPEEQWAAKATHLILENNWAVPFLREQGVDAVVVNDSAGTKASAHESMAVLNPEILRPLRRASAAGDQHTTPHPSYSTTMYHVSRSRNRKGIEVNGLVPQIKEFPGLKRKPAVYLLETMEQADDWAYWFGSEQDTAMDIWAVQLPEGLTVHPDKTDMDEVYDSWIVYDQIPSSCLRLLKTVGPEYPQDPPGGPSWHKNKKIQRTAAEDITYRDECLDYHDQEAFCRITAHQGGEVVGHIDYGVFEEEIHIKFVTVKADLRRQGIANAMMNKLREGHPATPISWGTLTDDGSALKAKTHRPEDAGPNKVLVALEAARTDFAQGAQEAYDGWPDNFPEFDNEAGLASQIANELEWLARDRTGAYANETQHGDDKVIECSDDRGNRATLTLPSSAFQERVDDKWRKKPGVTIQPEDFVITAPEAKQASSDGLQSLIHKYEAQGATIEVMEKHGFLELSAIRLPKELRNKGTGSAFMQEFVQYADNAGMTVFLHPTTDFGATSVARLKKFYGRFGFKSNKGRNKDFRSWDAMVRQPKKVKNASGGDAPAGWTAIEPPTYERHPSVDLSDEELASRAKNDPLPPPPGLPESALAAWDTVSRVLPELAARVSSVGGLDPKHAANATINVITGVLHIHPNRALTPATLWHELIHLDQPEAIRAGRDALSPDGFNALEIQARSGVQQALDRLYKVTSKQAGLPKNPPGKPETTYPEYSNGWALNPDQRGDNEHVDLEKMVVAAMPTVDLNPNEPVYLRIGGWNPANERSRNFAAGEFEAGLSVYDLDDSGNPVVPEEGEWAEDDLRDRLRSDAPKYLVQGDLVGQGHDGEPLLQNVRVVGEYAEQTAFKR